MSEAPIAVAPVAAHMPVLLDDVLDYLDPHEGGIYVDGTFGAGGYTRGLLERARCIVFAIDRDPRALAEGASLLAAYRGRLTLIEGRFGEMDHLLKARGVETVAGVTLDLGVSSMQLDEPERGLSFRFDAPLDMRMGRTGPTAAELVNEASEEELARIIGTYGEERRARAVARALVAARGKKPFERTGELADVIRRVVRPGRDGLDPATRTFQALRMAVNDELGELSRGLVAAERLLAPEGRFVVVAYHSLEDRRVKRFLAERAGLARAPSRHWPGPVTKKPQPSFRLLTRRARRPSAQEIARNPRARSARLRAAARTAAPAWRAA
jgi:16S rRNA (cytosine1402-N4)-methyltransferase